MITLSVDPGVKGCGIAIWDDGKLVHAQYVKMMKGGTTWREMAQSLAEHALPCPDVQRLVIEVPRVYQGTKQKGDPNDLIELAGVVGAITQLYQWSALTRYYPYEWKRSIPKDVCEFRIKSRLVPEELACVKHPAKSLRHNVWDAVGLGCHYLGRRLY